LCPFDLKLKDFPFVNSMLLKNMSYFSLTWLLSGVIYYDQAILKYCLFKS